MSKVVIALLHHPVLDRQGAVITTAITNLDLHDMARSACTFGVGAFYIVHPVAAQRELAERVKAHWVDGSGAKRIPTREPAMSLLRIVPAIEDVYASEGGRANVDVYVTSARGEGRTVMSYPEARVKMRESARTPLVLFGTGWGLAPALIETSDAFLAPIDGASATGYNHLSVRAACAIILDRLLGTRE
jgi:hypothetical protein